MDDNVDTFHCPHQPIFISHIAYEEPHVFALSQFVLHVELLEFITAKNNYAAYVFVF